MISFLLSPFSFQHKAAFERALAAKRGQLYAFGFQVFAS
jgi:hypothetical protein